MDTSYMRLAIEMAAAAKGQTSPNPLVGAIIIKEGRVIGMGAHLKAGEGHAEVQALKMAEGKAAGAIMYVTLEPCSHHGKTPPCADAIIKEGIKKVYIASKDPNPKVAGRGIQKLIDAGIEVEVGILEKEAMRLNAEFFHFIETKRPYVTLKCATSIDGKIATSTGESKWITGEESRLDTHRLRHEHDAILIGSGTLLKDNPSLTTRLPDGGSNPIRIIMDRRFRVRADLTLCTDGKAPTWIYTTENGVLGKEELVDRIATKGVKIIKLPEELFSVDKILKDLGDKGVLSVLVEGGGMIHDAFLNSGHFQQLINYQAPILIGGASAPSAFSGSGIENLKDVARLFLVSTQQLGNDRKFTYRNLEKNSKDTSKEEYDVYRNY